MRVEYETPTMSGTTTDCFAAVRPFIDALDSPAAAGDVQIIGGVSTSALSHPSTEIHVDTKEIIAPRGFSLSRHREDGTLRDVDVLVLSSNSQRVYEVERTLQQTTGNTLERSVFGIRPAESLREQTAHPLGLRALRTFLSDRYDTPRGASSRVKSLFPFAVPLPDETLETWSLIVLPEDDAAGEQVIPVPHPGTTLVNYCTRSISGLRPRDAAKITHVAENVFSVSPDIRSWLIDGPGASQLELGTLIASLRTPHQTGVSLLDGIRVTTKSHDELIETDAFMVPDAPEPVARRILGAAAIKAQVLYEFESHPRVVTAWRHLLEHQFDAIIKNK